MNFLLIENQRGGKGLTYVNVSELVDVFVRIGYSKEILMEELNQLLNKNLIVTSDYLTDIEEDIALEINSKIAISSVGNYYVSDLIKSFAYLDLTLQNTPIYSEKDFKEISKSFPESDRYGNRDLLKRLNSAKAFLGYLISQETHDLSRPKLVDENPALSQNITAEIEETFGEEVSSISKRVKSMT